MRSRRAIRTLLVFLLLGAVATVLSSWAIHAVQFRQLRQSQAPSWGYLPSIIWPLDFAVAREFHIDPDARSGEIALDREAAYWQLLLDNEFFADASLPAAFDLNADAVWRRHRSVDDISPRTPDYPFPYALFEHPASSRGWRILMSEAMVIDGALDRGAEYTRESIQVVHAGWPYASLEIGSHQAARHRIPDRLLEGRTAFGGPRGVAVHRPTPAVSFASGLRLWQVVAPAPKKGVHSTSAHISFDRFALPLLPLWPGFAINTVFYALLLFIAWRLPGVLRRAVRRRRGRCERCGYSRDGLDPDAACPECGAGVGARAATGPAAAT
ncbi:MAG: hypothetical protein RIE32_12730 [Phycisphaerales bacterium]